MFGKPKFAGLAVLMALFAGPALAAEPLVTTDWVKNNLDKEGVVILDVTSNPAVYAKGHIPGAVFTHYKKDKWRVDTKKNGHKVSGVLPPVEHMEKLIGGLGIGNDDHVVIVAAGSGAAEMGTATRLYWTFKVLGHDEVSILDGGMAAWLKDKANPLETRASKPTAKTFKADFRDDLIATTEEVEAALANGMPLIDSRPVGQHLGIMKSGKVRAFGTIPGAINVPGEYMTVNNGGQLRDKASLAKLYDLSNAPKEGEQITFCNTGHWASLGWFAAYALLGNEKAAMYDGSLSEWTTRDDHSMEQKVNLD